jgi:hypothetical protein
MNLSTRLKQALWANGLKVDEKFHEVTEQLLLDHLRERTGTEPDADDIAWARQIARMNQTS